MKRRTGLKKAQRRHRGPTHLRGRVGRRPWIGACGLSPGHPARVGSGHDGRSPDLRIAAFPAFPAQGAPVASWGRLPLTVAGAVADSAPDGYTSPRSLFTLPGPWPAREPSRTEMPPGGDKVNRRGKQPAANPADTPVTPAAYASLIPATGAPQVERAGALRGQDVGRSPSCQAWMGGRMQGDPAPDTAGLQTWPGLFRHRWRRSSRGKCRSIWLPQNRPAIGASGWSGSRP